MPNETVDTIGLGVDLLGGPELLGMLRAIRVEQEAILTLAGRGTSGSTSGFVPTKGPITEAGLAEQKRLASAQLTLTKETSEQEIEMLARAGAKKKLLQEEITRRTIQYANQEREAKQKQIQAERDLLAQQFQIRRDRIKLTAQEDPTILFDDLSSQRREFKKYRNDPARDPLTNRYRSEISERVQAQQLAAQHDLGEQARLEQDRLRIANEAEAVRRRAREQADERELAEIRAANARRATALKGNASVFNRDVFAGSAEEREIAYATPIGTTFKNLQRGNYADLYRGYDEPIHLNASRARQLPAVDISKFDENTDLSSLSAREYAALNKAGRIVSKGKTIQILPASGGPKPPKGGGPGGGGGGGGGEEEGGGDGGNEGLLTGAGGRLIGRFIAYQAITTLTYGVIRYAEASLQAAKATTESGNALKFATEAANGNLQANRQLSESLGQVGFNRAESAQVVAAAARATFRHPDQTAALTQEAVDIAAYRGGGLKEAPRVIEDIIGGRDRAYREYFNKTPEDIYKDAARQRLSQNTNTFGLTTIGKGQDYETEAQKISKYVAALTEEEKEQLRLNYVLSQSFRFQGDAAERATTLAGKMDLVSASFFNAKANVGAFLADLRPVKELMDQIGGATPSNILTPPQLTQTGPRGTITDTDIINYGDETQRGPRGRVLDAVSKHLSRGSDLVTAFATGGLSLLRTPIEGLKRSLQPGGTDQISDAEYDRLIAENTARDKQARQREALRRDNQIQYRAANPGQGNVNDYFSYQQLTARGLTKDDIISQYIEDIKPKLEDGAKALQDFNEKRRDLIDRINKDKSQGFDNKNAQDQLNLLDARRDAEVYAPFKPVGYEEEARKREDERKQKEQSSLREYVGQVGGALNKLRDAQQGAFRLPEEIGKNIAGSDNPYVKVLADQATAAERMRQQWGFLGKAATEYFTTIEQKGISKQLLNLDYQAYRTASGARGQAANELAERNGPGISRREQDYLNIQAAITNRAIQIPVLWKQAADILGQTIRPTDELLGKVGLITQAFGINGPNQGPFGNIFNTKLTEQSAISRLGIGNPLYSPLGQRQALARTGNPLYQPGGQDEFLRRNGNPLYSQTVPRDFAALGAGQSPEVKEAIQKSFSDSLLDAFKGYSPAQIRQSGLQSYYLGALNIQANSLGFNIDQARRKAEFGAQSDARLAEQLRQDEAFKAQRIAEGGDASDVGRASDALLLSRTDNINPKDLTFDQFKARQQAQKNVAENAERDRKEAKAAVAEGLKYQAELAEMVAEIRQAIIGGDMSMLIQVQNDTQARIDQKSLDAIASGKFNVPLDTGNTKSNPYTNSFDKYGRGGRKR